MTGPKQNYQVSSLYYDTFDQESFYTKEEGENSKIKLRVRYYDEKLSHFEIKEKEGRKNRKSKIELKVDQDMNILNQEKIRSLFQAPVIPSVWVRYHREGYHLKVRDEKVRITIDSEISFRKPTSLFYEKSLPSLFIVEFKYLNHLDDLDELYNTIMKKKPSSFSKFIEGVRCF